MALDCIAVTRIKEKKKSGCPSAVLLRHLWRHKRLQLVLSGEIFGSAREETKGEEGGKQAAIIIIAGVLGAKTTI